MAIFMNGTLSVQRISGTHGDFSVGKLECEVGILNVKDPQLDQYETGKYQGRFKVDRIYPHGYMARTGCFIVEVRAVVDEYIIHSDNPDDLDSEVALKDVDPLDMQVTAVILPEAVVLHSNNSPPELASANSLVSKTSAEHITPLDALEKESRNFGKPECRTEDPMAMLFGEIWPLGDEVKLDPTTIRTDAENHRKRTIYLRQHGYVFKAQSQSWELKQAQVAEGVLL